MDRAAHDAIVSGAWTGIALGISAGLAAAWWTWAFFLWQRENQWSRRVKALLGDGPRPRNRALAWALRLRSLIVRRFGTARFQRDLPDFFELLALAQSAGLSLPAAWAFAARMLESSALAPQLDAVRSSVRDGRSWDVALEAFASEIGDERCSWVVALMRQNLRRGSPLVQLLIDQVEQWRYTEAMNAEHRAQTLSLKLLAPIFIFLLPAVFIVLFAPLLLRFSQGIPVF